MKINFNLGWILAIAAAIIVAAMGFMSFYYLSEGELILPSIVAACLLVLPIVVNSVLVPSKECAKPFYFHQEAVKEASMLVVMALLFIASMPLVNHFFTVNARTEKIANTVADQRRQLDEMQQSYSNHIESRERNYRAYLHEVLDNKNHNMDLYNRVFPNGSNDIELMVRELHNKVSLDGLNDSVSAVYGRENISWWELPSVMNHVDEISTALDNNYKLMFERDHNFTKDEIAQEDYWSYFYTSAEDIKSNFTKSAGFISSLWTVLSVLLAYFFIMLPYFVAERDLRSDGLWAELRKSENFDGEEQAGIGRL